MTSEGVDRADDDGVEDEVVGAEPPPSPLAASVVMMVWEEEDHTLFLSVSRARSIDSPGRKQKSFSFSLSEEH